MLDFTSSLYLGLRHGSASLEPWDELTTGVPAALREAPAAEAVAASLAALIGGRLGLLLPSTLHLFWDLFGNMAGPGTAFFPDAGLYPTAWWGVERAAARGTAVHPFRHHDPEMLRWRLRKEKRRRRAVVVSDGFCPGCGKSAPLPEYLAAARAADGLLVVDDTQALGVFGSPAPGMPYGLGGGGSLARWRIRAPDVVVGASLAKALGVPVAVLAGDEDLMRGFQARSETREHSSPPSAAAIHAAASALAVNAGSGDALRRRLAERVSRFRDGLAELGLTATGGLFPVQRVLAGGPRRARALHERLLGRGVRTVLQRARCSRATTVTFVVTVDHEASQIERALDHLAAAGLAAPTPAPARVGQPNGAAARG